MVDYGEILSANWPCTDRRVCFSGYEDGSGLVYHIYRETADNVLTSNGYHWRYLLQYDNDVYYPTFPDIYMPNFCDAGQTGGDKDACNGDIYRITNINSSNKLC